MIADAFSRSGKEITDRLLGLMPPNGSFTCNDLFNRISPEEQKSLVYNYGNYDVPRTWKDRPRLADAFLVNYGFAEYSDNGEIKFNDRGRELQRHGSLSLLNAVEITEREHKEEREQLEMRKLRREVNWYKDPRWWSGFILGFLPTLGIIFKTLLERK